VKQSVLWAHYWQILLRHHRRTYFASHIINSASPRRCTFNTARVAVLAKSYDVLGVQEQIRPLSWRSQMMNRGSRPGTLPAATRDLLADRVPIENVDPEPLPRRRGIEPPGRIIPLSKPIRITPVSCLPGIVFGASPHLEPGDAFG
jgi:hypothetical protein